MDEPLLIITSFVLPEGASELPVQIRTAFEAHAANKLVGEVHILTDSTSKLTSELITNLGNSLSFTVFEHDSCPTIADLFEHASEQMRVHGRIVAIMNPEIRFCEDADIRRCLSSLTDIMPSTSKPVYALTRGGTLAKRSAITHSGEDEPIDTLSTDCWILATPVRLPKIDPYPLGRIYGDMLVNHALISAGYTLFNPCLDISISGHQPDPVPSINSSEQCQEADESEDLPHPAALFEKPDFDHYRIPRVASHWLAAGYQPEPFAHGRKKILVHIPGGCSPAMQPAFDRIEEYAISNAYDLILMAAEFPDELLTSIRPLLDRNKRMDFLKLDRSHPSLIASLLDNGHGDNTSIAFASSPRFLTEELASIANCILIDLGNCAASQPDVEDSQPPLSGDSCNQDPKCTLITSVFRSDPYLGKFLENTRALRNFKKELNHILLVSSTSPLERGLLADHLAGSHNVLMIWNKQDPGLYACWNLGIQLARTPYVSNANVDDLRAPNHVSELVLILDERTHVDVACTAIVPFETYTGEVSEIDTADAWYSDKGGEFGYDDLAILVENADSGCQLQPYNLPHCMPVWRRSLHDKYGFFDETNFGTYADWAFWLNVTRDGASGYLHPEPLSFYFVNPGSHNRRGAELEELHRRIEMEHLEEHILRKASYHQGASAAGGNGRIAGPVERKLNLGTSDTVYGQHRNPFNALIESLRPLHHGPGGILFLPFIERHFVWGEMDGEALSKSPRPIETDWIGILHVPFDSPKWFDPSVCPETFFATDLWKRSIPSCQGLICLSKDMRVDLAVQFPDLPTLALKHPTNLEAKHFDFEAYMKNPRVVQIGDWLRQLQAIYRIQAVGHEKWMLRKHWTVEFLNREIKTLGNFVNDTVNERDFVSNELYDEILSSSVVICLLYASAANNVVLECIARNTPIIINPLPSVVEYLGEDYPLYATSIEQADLLLSNPNLILEASRALSRQKQIIDFSYEGFYSGMANSSFYADL